MTPLRQTTATRGKNVLVRFFAGVTLLFGISSSAMAANICVGPSATGNGTGADWNNLKAWSAAPVRGDTWYLRDSDGTNYSGKTFATAASGTTLITIKKATVADHGIATNWVDTMGDGQATFSGTVKFNSSYWVFDGVKGDFPSKVLSDYGFYFPSTSFVIILEGARTFTNVTCSHISATSISADTPRYAFGTDGATLDTTNITFSHNCITGFQVAFFVSGPTGRHGAWILEYNVILNALSTDNNHGSGLDCNYGMQNPIYRYNIMQGYSGGGCQTCAIEANNGDMTGAEVYGNVFEGLSNCNECIGGTSAGMFSNAKIYNNTFYQNTGGGAYMVPWVGAGDKGGSGIVAYNNLIVSQQGHVGGGTTHDYTAFFGASSIPSETNGQTASGNPLKNPSVLDYSLTSNTSPGKPLLAPYNMDALGHVRTTWTRGAYEYNGTPPTPTPPSISAQPTNQAVIVGQVASFSVNATGNPVPTYQWQKNNNNITGATSASYTTAVTALGDSGTSYRVIVTNSQGSVTSNNATLTVNPIPPMPNIPADTIPVTQFGPIQFNVTSAGVYKLIGSVKGPSMTENSLYLNIDSDPGVDNHMAWDLNVGTTFGDQEVTWRGVNYQTADLPALAEFIPKKFDLTVGVHTLYISQREANAEIQSIRFVKDTGSTNTHPADTNADFLMSLNEAVTFATCYKTDCDPAATLGNAVRGGTLWRGSTNGQYEYTGSLACPLCWEVKP